MAQLNSQTKFLGAGTAPLCLESMYISQVLTGNKRKNFTFPVGDNKAHGHLFLLAATSTHRTVEKKTPFLAFPSFILEEEVKFICNN